MRSTDREVDQLTHFQFEVAVRKQHSCKRDHNDIKVNLCFTLEAVADWLGCQFARWQVGPSNRRQFGPPRKCGKEAKKNSFSKTHKQNSPLPQGPCFGVRHPFLGIYCLRNSTSQTAGGRPQERRSVHFL
ncbi:hypothetical protein AVEN_38580-1 [Araneus ventricosus]|uniref:Uncharacterized protein n=1 Tax=Araneus ventricosus TaxID=182803 RepID=A0A4Y2EY67_ARAVE|nr:hypothetical protein AVEN_38580-1 [Araneus ventricosus]